MLGDKPLLIWTLQAAFDSECFSRVVLSTESLDIGKTALDWCGKSLEFVLRPRHMAEDRSPDIDWVKHALNTLTYRHVDGYDVPVTVGDQDYCLLRPTSPFRGPETIQRAVLQWQGIRDRYDSLRAVRRATEHPQKMWTLTDFGSEIQPWPSQGFWSQVNAQPWNKSTQSLAEVYIQTGSLEIAWTRTPLEKNSISGDRVAGFIMEGPEAIDINTEEDWQRAEQVILHKAEENLYSQTIPKIT